MKILEFMPFPFALEIVLWIEAYIGWAKIPVFTKISAAIQYYLVTSPPGENQLKIARIALIELIKRHEQP